MSKPSLREALACLDEFSETVASNLDEADWSTRREILRTLIASRGDRARANPIVYRINFPLFAKKASKAGSEKVLHFCWRRGFSTVGQCGFEPSGLVPARPRPTRSSMRRGAMRSGHPNVRFVRYADDWCVFITRGSKRYAERLRDRIREMLDRDCGVRLSDEKTRITHVRDGFDFLGFHMTLGIGQGGTSCTQDQGPTESNHSHRPEVERSDALSATPGEWCSPNRSRLCRDSWLVQLLSYRPQFQSGGEYAGPPGVLDCNENVVSQVRPHDGEVPAQIPIWLRHRHRRKLYADASPGSEDGLLVFTLQIRIGQALVAISKTSIGKSTFDSWKVDAQAAWTPRL